MPRGLLVARQHDDDVEAREQVGFMQRSERRHDDDNAALHIDDAGAARREAIDPLERLERAGLLEHRIEVPDEEQPWSRPAVIGHEVWQSRFYSNPNVVGSIARLGSTEYTVVGVMPERFAFPVNDNLWVPLKSVNAVTQIFGRLKEGTTAATAEAELRAT